MKTTNNTAAQVEALTQAITANKELSKRIASNKYYSVETFINDANAYISAITEGRMINVIGSVAKSGMSRSIKFTSCEVGNNGRYYQRNYIQFFSALGYREARNGYGYFTVGGCGMDMIFHTNYTIIHRLFNLGFIDKPTCEHLAQQTPTTI
jgi:hypothetical protein